ALLALRRVAVKDLVDLLLQGVQVLGARLLVDPGDDRGCEVEDLLQFLWRHVEQVADSARHALEEPDVAHGRGEVDVPHALAAHLGDYVSASFPSAPPPSSSSSPSRSIAPSSCSASSVADSSLVSGPSPSPEAPSCSSSFSSSSSAASPANARTPERSMPSSS